MGSYWGFGGRHQRASSSSSSSTEILHASAWILRLVAWTILPIRYSESLAGAWSCKNNNKQSSITPPVAERHESAVTWVPAQNPPLLQAQDSPNALVDPPRAIPNPYGWIREKKDPKVIQLLKDENEYTEACTEHLHKLRETLYEELKGRVQETDYTLPRPHGDYWYYTRTYEGLAYQAYCRAPILSTERGLEVPLALEEWDGSPDTPILLGEVVYLDENQMAVEAAASATAESSDEDEGKDSIDEEEDSDEDVEADYCVVDNVEVSPSQSFVALTVDFQGDEIYQLQVRKVPMPVTGAEIEGDGDEDTVLFQDPELEVAEDIEWGYDDSTIYYLTMDDTQRPYRVYRKHWQDEDSEDELIFEESDIQFWVGISKSLDGQFLFVHSASSETSEVHYLDLTDPKATLQCVAKRQFKVSYEVDHRHGQWWIASNIDKTPNLAVYVAPAVPESQELWKPIATSAEPTRQLFDGSLEIAVEDLSTFDSHVLVQGREGGLPRVWILKPLNATATSSSSSNMTVVESCTRLEFPEAAHTVGIGAHYEFAPRQLVVEYDSLVTPPQALLLEFSTPNDDAYRTVVKEANVPGYKKEDYSCDRFSVLARDGKTEIPVSAVGRKDVLKSGKPAPVLLYAYGAYGSSEEDEFMRTLLPLLDRGMIYVVAHVRGGGEMGRQWYEEPNGGKYLCKKNTFTDVIDTAEWLIENGWTTPESLACEGRSAGGLCMAAALNLRPDLFTCAILGVPFVDVVATMVDSSIPLVGSEWEEWGNPNEEKYLDYMLEYSPIDNILPDHKYPSCLVLAGLHDPRVQYWEPAKYVQMLRHTASKDSGVVCLKTEMDSGHFSASDRYKYLREMAFDYAFLLDRLGLA